ncbi:MAG: hypothetical protein ABI478_14005, partial [Propionivibrio sp.]
MISLRSSFRPDDRYARYAWFDFHHPDLFTPSLPGLPAVDHPANRKMRESSMNADVTPPDAPGWQGENILSSGLLVVEQDEAS